LGVRSTIIGQRGRNGLFDARAVFCCARISAMTSSNVAAIF